MLSYPRSKSQESDYLNTNSDYRNARKKNVPNTTLDSMITGMYVPGKYIYRLYSCQQITVLLGSFLFLQEKTHLFYDGVGRSLVPDPVRSQHKEGGDGQPLLSFEHIAGDIHLKQLHTIQTKEGRGKSKKQKTKSDPKPLPFFTSFFFPSHFLSSHYHRPPCQ